MIQDTSNQDVLISTKPTSRYGKYAMLLGAILGVVYLVMTFSSDILAADVVVDRERLRIAPVTRSQFIRDIAVQGNVVAANSPKLYAPAEGRVRYLVNPGRSVAKSQTVAVVESPELTNRLQQETAKLESLAIDLQRKKIEAKQKQMESRQKIKLEAVVLAAAEREKRRADQSIKINAISQLDFEKATDDLERSKLNHQFSVEQAELEKERLAFELQTSEFEFNQYALQVENTQRLVDALTLKAPVAGIIGSWSAEQQAAVTANQALLTVVDLSELEVEIDIPEAYADSLGIGMTAKILDDDKVYTGIVSTISPEVINNRVKGRVAFVEQAPASLKQNQRVRTRIVIDQKNSALVLPNGAFMQHHGGKKIFLVNQMGAELIPVSLGAASVDHVEVLGGLTEGAQVVISNTSFVSDAENIIFK